VTYATVTILAYAGSNTTFPSGSFDQLDFYRLVGTLHSLLRLTE
jgi:hypothetical protein